jgi:hypothetical protein
VVAIVHDATTSSSRQRPCLIFGGTAVQVDDFSSTRNASGIVWTSAVLSAGTHTVPISSTNTKNGASSGYTVAIDSADITS